MKYVIFMTLCVSLNVSAVTTVVLDQESKISGEIVEEVNVKNGQKVKVKVLENVLDPKTGKVVVEKNTVVSGTQK